MNICKVCGKEIQPTGKRGRPALICPECKAAKKVKAPKAVAAPVAEAAPVVAVETK